MIRILDDGELLHDRYHTNEIQNTTNIQFSEKQFDIIPSIYTAQAQSLFSRYSQCQIQMFQSSARIHRV